MLRRLLLVLLLLAPLGAQPQPAPDPPPVEPEEIGVVYCLEAAGLRPLEGLRATREGRSGFFSGVQSVLVVPGERSLVRFPVDQKLEFVVRVFMGGLPNAVPLPQDPRALFFGFQDPTRWELLKLEKDGKERVLVLYDAGLFNQRGSEGVLVVVRPYGPASFRLTTAQPLPPGEYAFHYGACEAGSTQNLFTFGVDQVTLKK